MWITAVSASICTAIIAPCEPPPRMFAVDETGPLEYFGVSIDADEDTLIVGALSTRTLGQNAGAAYLIDRATGNLIAKLLPASAGTSQYFGSEVKIWNGVAYVGCASDAARAGVGVIYRFNARTGDPLGIIVPPDSTEGDYFGSFMDIDGDAMLVSAVTRGFPGPNSGKMYLIDLPTGSIVQEYTDTNPETETFGVGVALTADHAISWRFDSATGIVVDTELLVFDRHTGELIADVPPPIEGEEIGWGIDANDSVCLISSITSNLAGARAGAVHVFDLRSLTFIGRILPPRPSTGGLFGSSISVRGSFAAIGSPYTDLGIPRHFGRVDVFDLQSGALLAYSEMTPDESLYFMSEEYGRDLVLERDALLASSYETWTTDGGWGAVFQVPMPELCRADVNRDCVLDPADFGAWISAFNAQAQACDQNADGACTPADFSAWVANYNAGC